MHLLFWLIDTPAKFFGELVGYIFPLISLGGVIWVSVNAYKFAIYTLDWRDRLWKKRAALCASIALGVYLSLVAYRASYWMGFQLLNNAN